MDWVIVKNEINSRLDVDDFLNMRPFYKSFKFNDIYTFVTMVISVNGIELYDDKPVIKQIEADAKNIEYMFLIKVNINNLSVIDEVRFAKLVEEKSFLRYDHNTRV